MNCSFYIEFGQYKVDIKDIKKRIKKLWRDRGNKIKDISSLDIYFKAEEGTIYYVINRELKGNLELETFEEHKIT